MVFTVFRMFYWLYHKSLRYLENPEVLCTTASEYCVSAQSASLYAVVVQAAKRRVVHTRLAGRIHNPWNL